MGYLVKLDVVTNKEGLDTLTNHEGFSGLISAGYVTATKIDDVFGGIYHLDIDKHLLLFLNATICNLKVLVL